MNGPGLSEQFPELFEKRHWGPVEIVFEAELIPPTDLISNVNLIPFAKGGMVVLRLADGRPEPPGGTLEPGETWLDALHRELVEEAGAVLRSFTPLGSWRWITSAPSPFRPHLPHPLSYRFVGYGDIDFVSSPTNPPGEEQIVSVDVMSLEEAVRLFIDWDRRDIAALYHLASVRSHRS